MDRKICTKENPSDGTPYEWCHPDAKCTGRSHEAYYSDDDSWDEMKCPHCGIVFKETVSK